MKSLILYLFILFAFFISAARTLPPLPAPAFADGEVSRCYPFDQAGIGNIRIDLSASFIGTASNNLEIAFGTDANHDGELSLRETDLILGWSCGRYFLERFKASEIYEETNVGTNDFACSLGWNSLRPSVRPNNQSSGQDVANMRRHVELLPRRQVKYGIIRAVFDNGIVAQLDRATVS